MRILRLVFFNFVLLLFPLFLFAQGNGVFENPIGYDSLDEFLVRVLDAVVIIMFPIVALFVVYTGFLFVTAQGNEEKINTAKKTALWTIVGAILVLGARALAEAIRGTVDQIQGGGF